ncbi:hypothetical protein IV203_034328 [Nitzschia inconspicua]|uniref:Tyr recombinase domain-containing protein n=1 Tax=Nitzschia inconspicua TaxID=303405 RepID=A0A9K3Q9P2_9STRA|nr:hypothetical protein IV203_034328 [Nitzschia inconspicua]
MSSKFVCLSFTIRIIFRHGGGSTSSVSESTPKQPKQPVDAQYNSAWKMSHYGTTHRFFTPPYHSRPCSLNVTCPIAAIIRRVHHIRQHTSDPATMLGTYFTGHKHVAKQVTVTDITTALKNTVQVLGLSRYNITPADISSHSLRAGGAMALHLGGVPAHTIKILGRWSSDTFLLYIQEQITGFSAGLSTQMSSTPLTPNAAIKPTLRLLPS